MFVFILSCSNQKDTAIENCADNNYMEEHEAEFVNKFFDKNDEQIINLQSAISNTKIKQIENKKKIDQFLLNLDINQKKLMKATFGKLTDNQKEKKRKLLTNYNKLLDAEISLEKALIEQEGIIYYSKSRTAWKEFEKTKLKSKINLSKYYNEYVKCEKEHMQSPSAFEMKWKNKN